MTYLHHSIRRSADGVRLFLVGEADFMERDALRVALGEATAMRPARLVIDTTALDFIDAACVSALVVLVTSQTEVNCRVSVVGAHGAVHRVLELCDLLDLLRVQPLSRKR